MKNNSQQEQDRKIWVSIAEPKERIVVSSFKVYIVEQLNEKDENGNGRRTDKEGQYTKQPSTFKEKRSNQLAKSNRLYTTPKEYESTYRAILKTFNQRQIILYLYRTNTNTTTTTMHMHTTTTTTTTLSKTR